MSRHRVRALVAVALLTASGCGDDASPQSTEAATTSHLSVADPTPVETSTTAPAASSTSTTTSAPTSTTQTTPTTAVEVGGPATAVTEDQALGIRLTLHITETVVGPEESAHVTVNVENIGNDGVTYESNTDFVRIFREDDRPGWYETCPNGRATVSMPAELEPGESLTLVESVYPGEDEALCRLERGRYAAEVRFAEMAVSGRVVTVSMPFQQR